MAAAEALGRPINPAVQEAVGAIDPFSELALVRQYAGPSAQIAPDINIKALTSDDPTMPGTVRKLGQSLHTRAYLITDLIEPSDLDENGLYTDEHEAHATRYLIINGHRVATGRRIHTDDRGLLSLPTLGKHFGIDPDELLAVADEKRLVDIRPSSVVEISGLAVEAIPNGQRGHGKGEYDAVDALYVRMMAASIEAGESVWVMNIEPWLLGKLRTVTNTKADKDAEVDHLHVLGDPQQYMGPETVPVALNTYEVARSILVAGPEDPAHYKYGTYLRACLQGASEVNIPADIRSLLRGQGVQLRQQTLIERAQQVARSPRAQTSATLVGYSLGRDVAVHYFLHQFHGNLPELMAIDGVTAFIQAQALYEAYTAKHPAVRVGALAVGLAMFSAPYAYIASEGQGYPWWAKAIAGGMVSLGVYMEARRAVHEVRLRRGLVASEHSQPEQEQASRLLTPLSLQ